MDPSHAAPPKPPAPPTGPVPAGSRIPTTAEEIKRLIARRKRADRVFAAVGLICILFAIGTLGALLVDLGVSGIGRLFETHLVKPDGTAPGRRELAGTFARASGGDDGNGFVFKPKPLRLETKLDLTPLVGQAVVSDGLPPAGEPSMPAEDLQTLRLETDTGPTTAPAVAEAPGGVATRIGRRDLVGTIEKRPLGGFRFAPAPLRVTGAPDGVDLASFGDDPVAIDGDRDTAAGTIAVTEVARLEPQSFFFSMPSREAGRAGILSAWVGSILVMLVTAAAALPLGIAAGIYLEEYAPKNKLTALIEINIANLAGVPSIIWGLMALGLFVYLFRLGNSVATAGLTLGLLVLPIVIIATREAIRAIPATIREASIALGATKWQTVWNHIIPYSLSGILTGSIIGLSRAIGETAPLITVGALTYIAFLPPAPVTLEPELSVQPVAWLQSPFTVMPIQMFNWISRPDPRFHENAAAAGVVLVAMTLGMNAIAIVLRYRLRKRINW